MVDTTELRTRAARLADAAAIAAVVQALVMWLGGHSVLNHSWSVGDYFAYNMFLAFMIAPVFQIVSIGTQLTAGALQLVRAQGGRVVARCPYVAQFIAHNAQYQDLLAQS